MCHAIDETRLRAEARQLEGLIDELHELLDPVAWQRIERVLRVTITLYGTGLAHALDHARTAGANGEMDELIANDDLLASLLVLHDLHPLPTAERVKRAVLDVRRRLGLTATDLDVVAIDASGATLRVSTSVAEAAARRAIEESAPELASIDFERT